MIVGIVIARRTDIRNSLYIAFTTYRSSGFYPVHERCGVIHDFCGNGWPLAVWHPVPSRLDTGRRRDDLAAPATLIDAVLYDDPLTPHSTAPLLSDFLWIPSYIS